jgi:membrane protein insertase Oxa1/YidC/SpoIIIJ
MLPAVWVQGRAQGRLAAAMPDIRMVWQAYSAAQRGTKAMEVAERAENVKLLLAGLRAAVGVHQVSPIQTMLAPLVNIPVFMCFVFAIRDLIASRGLELGLAQGGAFWFVDLTTRDTSLALPLGAIALSYASIEAGLGRVESGPLRVGGWVEK